MRSVGQTQSLYKTALQKTSEHLFQDLYVKSRIREKKKYFSLEKNTVVGFFSGSDDTLKVSKNLGFMWRWLFLFLH